jgi:N-acetylmuramoyl-L-alanine amidase
VKRRFAVIAGVLCVAALAWVAAPALSLHPYVPRAVDFEMAVPASGKARAAGSVTTGVLRAPHRFDALGVRWRGKGAVTIRLRVRRDGGRWSHWVTAPQADTAIVGHGPGARGTDPVWAGGANFFQLRLSRPLRGLKVHFVNTTGTASRGDRLRTTLRRAVHSAVALLLPGSARAQGNLTVIARDGWGASQCPPRVDPSYGRVDLAFVHHTVSANDYSPQDSAAIVLAICRYHRNSNGWNDIGYNFLVDKYGQVFEGRSGGIDQAVIGAQAQGYNSSSTGIATIGTWSDVPLPDAALDSVANVIGWKLPLHGVPVTGEVTVTSGGGSLNRYPSGRKVTFNRISGHRDGDSTECPGNPLYAQLPTLRDMVAARAPVSGPVGFSRRLSLTATARELRYPTSMRLSGRLMAPEGEVVSGVEIHVQAVKGRSIRRLGEATTDVNGEWALTLASPRSRSLRAVEIAASANVPRTASPILTVTVAPVVSARLAARRITAGGAIGVSGKIAPRKRKLALQFARQKRAGGYGVGKVMPIGARNGRFARALRLREPGLYRVRALFQGDATNAPAHSRWMYVRAVRAPSPGDGTGGATAGAE